MIPANELRIGNWIADSGGKMWQIDYWERWDKVAAKPPIIGGFEGHPFTENIYDLSPIPITPELLERLGFGGDTILGKHYKYSKDAIEIWHDTTLNAFFVDNIKNKMVYLKYIHQLQNLYFALTGNELTTK